MTNTHPKPAAALATAPRSSPIDARHAEALADSLVNGDQDPDQRRTAIAAAAHHWLRNRHQLAAALARLDRPTATQILAVLQEEPTP